MILCTVVLSAELPSVFVLKCSEHEVGSAEKDVFVVVKLRVSYAYSMCHEHR